MILFSSQVNLEEPRNIPQAHWKQNTSVGAKSVPARLWLLFIITTSHSLEFINITILKNYKYLMSQLPQLRFIWKRPFSLIGKTVPPQNLSTAILPLHVSERGSMVDKKGFHEWMKPQDDFGASVVCFSSYMTIWTGPLLVMTSPSVGLSLMTSSLHPDHITGHFLSTSQWPWGHLKGFFFHHGKCIIFLIFICAAYILFSYL